MRIHSGLQVAEAWRLARMSTHAEDVTVDASRQRSWVVAALIAGVAYLVIGRVFAWPATHVQAWRLAAWVASLVVFGTHIAYEHFTLRNAGRWLALHAAVGVAIGACALAAAAGIHSLWVTSTLRPLFLVALVAWPALTGIPAFVAAWIAGALLARMAPRR